MLESDRWWPDLCHHLGREDLLADPRFVDAQARTENSAACAEELADTFAAAPLDEWRRRLATLRAPWEVVQNQLEVLDDPQARDNGYVTEVDHPGGRRITVVRAPIQFDEALTSVGTALSPARTPRRCSSRSATTGTTSRATRSRARSPERPSGQARKWAQNCTGSAASAQATQLGLPAALTTAIRDDVPVHARS